MRPIFREVVAISAFVNVLALAVVVSDSWWKFVFGVAPDPDSHSIMRRGQAAARQGLGPAFASHRPAAW
ncbi:MAG TPA: hypothetical protein QF556_09155, partial [Rhodospirillales bacterium]|nr:hypothetical protein [Rhodospirillales bacterium]